MNKTMQKEYRFFIYILTNYTKTVFYVGFTNSIIRRMIEHNNNFGCIFSIKYKLKYLVYFEECADVYSGIEREKMIKKWRREKKINLIRNINPDLNDLSGKLFRDNDITEKEIVETAKELREKYVPQGNLINL